MHALGQRERVAASHESPPLVPGESQPGAVLPDSLRPAFWLQSKESPGCGSWPGQTVRVCVRTRWRR